MSAINCLRNECRQTNVIDELIKLINPTELFHTQQVMVKLLFVALVNKIKTD